ncbi:uncharacterized protein [Drosophila tropicalis]|uniref:uncharacterized protein n=1 Tax=Drosophila tropicalis TaxID=46794 RepID=UPI0035AB6AD5
MRKILLPVFVCAVQIALCSSEASFSQDTYVNALQNSHSTDFDNGGGYQYNPPPNNNYLPPPTAPAPVYGPPPQQPQPVYGPPPPFYKPAPPIPYQSHDSWFLEKLKSKINLFTLGKIMLKLLIFKKIVKFIGVICLLLFLPKLKNMFKDDMSMEDMEGMESKHGETEKDKLQQQIDDAYEFIMNSIEGFERKHL